MLDESREAILTAGHVQFCLTSCMPIAPIATLPIEPLVYLVSVFLDLGMAVSCNCDMIMSHLLWVRTVQGNQSSLHVIVLKHENTSKRRPLRI